MSINLKIVKKRSKNSSKIDPEEGSKYGNTDTIEPLLHTRKKQPSPIKNWAFTLNNFEENEIQSSIVPAFKNYCQYYTFAIEKGTIKGTTHLQGRFTLNKKRRLTEIKKIFGDKFHFEPERNEKASAEYVVKDCKKKEDIYTNQWNTNTSDKVKFYNLKDKAFKWFDIDETHYYIYIIEWCVKESGGIQYCTTFEDLALIREQKVFDIEQEYFWEYLHLFYIDDHKKYMDFYVLYCC